MQFSWTRRSEGDRRLANLKGVKNARIWRNITGNLYIFLRHRRYTMFHVTIITDNRLYIYIYPVSFRYNLYHRHLHVPQFFFSNKVQVLVCRDSKVPYSAGSFFFHGQLVNTTLHVTLTGWFLKGRCNVNKIITFIFLVVYNLLLFISEKKEKNQFVSINKTGRIGDWKS